MSIQTTEYPNMVELNRNQERETFVLSPRDKGAVEAFMYAWHALTEFPKNGVFKINLRAAKAINKVCHNAGFDPKY